MQTIGDENTQNTDVPSSSQPKDVGKLQSTDTLALELEGMKLLLALKDAEREAEHEKCEAEREKREAEREAERERFAQHEEGREFELLMYDKKAAEVKDKMPLVLLTFSLLANSSRSFRTRI